MEGISTTFMVIDCIENFVLKAAKMFNLPIEFKKKWNIVHHFLK